MKIKNILFLTTTFLISTSGTLMASVKTQEVISAPNYVWYAVAGGLTIGLATLGGTLAQGRAAAAAMEGIARNPNASEKIFVPLILVMALIESIVLFGLLIAFMLVEKIT